ncbi:hypothetical protein STCU_11255 [Strigomonas culicis]|uniref:Uncharacterized protein n=1 Tax=Strigomonas culicis TaxID=28005 RepID=S9TEH0_9TRYP|nr:hypothetical protein STCU_11255 [Strigomonas culicis]|eukprot:EPY16452.1 hypothetical protein STCU_11255 [Strigomonas culicis]
MAALPRAASSRRGAAAAGRVSRLLEYASPHKAHKDVSLYQDIRDVRLRRPTPRLEDGAARPLPSETSMVLPSALAASETSRSEGGGHPDPGPARRPHGVWERSYAALCQDKSPSAESAVKTIVRLIEHVGADRHEGPEPAGPPRQGEWPPMPSLSPGGGAVVGAAADSCRPRAAAARQAWQDPPPPARTAEEDRLLALSDWWWKLAQHHRAYGAGPGPADLPPHARSPFAAELPLELLVEALQTLLDEKEKKQALERQAPSGASPLPARAAALWQGDAGAGDGLGTAVHIHLHYEAVGSAEEGAPRAALGGLLHDSDVSYWVYAVCEAQRGPLRGASRHTGDTAQGHLRDVVCHDGCYRFEEQLPMFVSFSAFISLYEWVAYVQTIAEAGL